MSPAAALPIVGVPRETKPGEHRVAITPDGVAELVSHGVEVLVEHDAGADSAITDVEYRAAGAQIVDAAADVWVGHTRINSHRRRSLRQRRALRRHGAARPRALGARGRCGENQGGLRSAQWKSSSSAPASAD